MDILLHGAKIWQLAAWLWTLSAGQPQRVAVAIEVPRGAIVEGLVERGFNVFAINPKQLDRFRDRHSVAGAKDDRRDAFVLADSVRTDQPRCPFRKSYASTFWRRSGVEWGTFMSGAALSPWE
jgi:transposase